MGIFLISFKQKRLTPNTNSANLQHMHSFKHSPASCQTSHTHTPPDKAAI